VQQLVLVIVGLETRNRNIDEFVHKQINKTSVKNATSRDCISAKLLKLAKPVIAKPITKMINKTITNSVFPDQLKRAQVVALHKKSLFPIFYNF
jgi:hypothetical protein